MSSAQNSAKTGTMLNRLALGCGTWPAFDQRVRKPSSVRLFAVDNADRAAVDRACRDPRDNQFLALALVSEADALVSSDEDLLVLHPWRGIPIVTPAEFLG